ncbi:MAG: CAP domain-containing protein [Candidatus Woykebacteria bacterium]
MGSLLAKWIYPHIHNDHRPYAIRHQSLFVFVVIVAIAQIVSNTFAGDLKILGYATNINKLDIIKLTNQERANNGARTLEESSLLDQAAAKKADHMFAQNYWAHFAPDGTSPWHFFQQVGYKYSWAGENLARDFQTSTGVMNGWMNSTTGHRENVLNSQFTQIGVVVKNGVLLGEETTLVVQLFGRPVTYEAQAPPPQVQVGTETKVEDKLALQAGTPTASSNNQQVSTTTAPVDPENNNSAFNIAGALDNLSTSQKTSFSLLFVLGSLFVIDSTTIFRRRHERLSSHSGLHASVIFVLLVTLFAQSVGSIV